MLKKISEIDYVLLSSFKKTIVYAVTFEILGIIVAIVSHNIYACRHCFLVCYCFTADCRLSCLQMSDGKNQ